MSLQKLRPNPTPLIFDYNSFPKVAYGYVNFGIISFLIPVPVSITSNFKISFFALSIINSIPPLFVNLIALPIILINIYFKRFLSLTSEK